MGVGDGWFYLIVMGFTWSTFHSYCVYSFKNFLVGIQMTRGWGGHTLSTADNEAPVKERIEVRVRKKWCLHPPNADLFCLHVTRSIAYSLHTRVSQQNYAERRGLQIAGASTLLCLFSRSMITERP